MLEATVRRGERRKQPTWVWLAALTANRGSCTYCDTKPSTTLDHDEPVADDGADIWWNFVPSCKPCNDWKGKRTATEWLRDQKLHREHPRVGFDTRMMPVKMVAGFKTRVERVKRELTNADRRDWFRHHYGRIRHKNKAEMRTHLATCEEQLRSYPHMPWTTPNVRPAIGDRCTRRMCCGFWHPEAYTIPAVILAPEQWVEFEQAAFNSGLSQGDLAAKLIVDYLSLRKGPEASFES